MGGDDVYNLMKQNKNQDETSSFEEEIHDYKQVVQSLNFKQRGDESQLSVPD